MINIGHFDERNPPSVPKIDGGLGELLQRELVMMTMHPFHVTAMKTTTQSKTKKLLLLFHFAESPSRASYDIREVDFDVSSPWNGIDLLFCRDIDRHGRAIGTVAMAALSELSSVAMSHGLESPKFDDAWHRHRRELPERIRRKIGLIEIE